MVSKKVGIFSINKNGQVLLLNNGKILLVNESLKELKGYFKKTELSRTTINSEKNNFGIPSGYFTFILLYKAEVKNTSKLEYQKLDNDFFDFLISEYNRLFKWEILKEKKITALQNHFSKKLPKPYIYPSR